jgi:DNA-directed RNA polymerase specialized sigma24 family protein
MRSGSVLDESSRMSAPVTYEWDATDGGSAWAADVRQALQSLDRDVVVALNLVYRDRLTQQQTARRLGVPLSTVRARVLLGLQGLAAALA